MGFVQSVTFFSMTRYVSGARRACVRMSLIGVGIRLNGTRAHALRNFRCHQSLLLHGGQSLNSVSTSLLRLVTRAHMLARRACA